MHAEYVTCELNRGKYVLYNTCSNIEVGMFFITHASNIEVRMFVITHAAVARCVPIVARAINIEVHKRFTPTTH